MSQIAVSGPPRRAATPLIGYPWEVPLSEPPSVKWVASFDAIDWRSRSRAFARHPPRVRDSLVVVPSIAAEGDLQQAMGTVLDAIQEVSGEVGAAEDQAAREAAERKETSQQQVAADNAAMANWFEQRQQRP